MEVSIFVGDAIRGTGEVVLELETGATCAQALHLLLAGMEGEGEGLASGKGAWRIEEEWEGCSK